MPICSPRVVTCSFRVVWLLVLLLLACACGDSAEPAFRVGELSYAADEIAGFSPAQLQTLADISGFAQAVADEETDALGAPLIQRASERSRLPFLPYALAAREMGIADEQLRTAYEAQPEWELNVRHVIRLVPDWATPAERDEARRIAEEVQQRAAAGEDFAALAAEYSEEPGAAERGGLLEPGREGSWVEPFWEAASQLEPGEVSPVVETPYGVHVLRLDARRPVPWEEANRTRLLTRLLPEAQAEAALRRWAEQKVAELELVPPTIAAAGRMLPAGDAPDSLVLARWPGGSYTARELALARAALGSAAGERLDLSDDLGLARFVESDAIDAMWTGAAEELGVEIPAGAEAEAEREWQTRAARLAAALGVRAGMGADALRGAALAAVGGTGQEERIARQELEVLRPLLRRRYGVSGPALSVDSATASSSETANSENTG